MRVVGRAKKGWGVEVSDSSISVCWAAHVCRLLKSLFWARTKCWDSTRFPSSAAAAWVIAHTPACFSLGFRTLLIMCLTCQGFPFLEEIVLHFTLQTHRNLIIRHSQSVREMAVTPLYKIHLPSGPWGTGRAGLWAYTTAGPPKHVSEYKPGESIRGWKLTDGRCDEGKRRGRVYWRATGTPQLSPSILSSSPQ